jgi:thiol-disulfide isomerase/thioredoxin
MKRWAILGTGACVTFLAAVVARAGVSVTTAPATQASARTLHQIMGDWIPIVKGLGPIYNAHRDWSDPAKREMLAPIARPYLKKGMALLNEMNASGSAREGDADLIYEMSALFGDAGDQEQVASLSQGPAPLGEWARVGELAAAFYKANGDAAAQGRVLDQMQKLAATDPGADKSLAWAGADLYQNGKPSPDNSDRLELFVTTTLKSDAIKQVKASHLAEATLKGLEKKPLVLTGVLRDGTMFTSADMKGKVILVDFWASWCGPCKAELPRVKKMYADYHEKGLEVIGVSCDYKLEDLNKFLVKNPDMPWPQMFDENKPGWHALTKQFGITGIPTMFLIDKNGICRSVTARATFEEEIPKLLAEQPAK